MPQTSCCTGDGSSVTWANKRTLILQNRACRPGADYVRTATMSSP